MMNIDMKYIQVGVLELIKTGFVEVKQECPEDDIFIRVVRDPELIEDITEE